MRDSLSRLVNVKPGEWKLALSILLLLALNMMVLEISEVVATAGFIGSVGTSLLPWLWILDMGIILISVAGYAVFVDRLSRPQLVGGLFGIFALFYLIVLLLFAFGAPDWLNYPLLYLLADQQYALFPLALWALANDLYTMSEAKRLFPLVAAGTALGSLVGNGLAAASAAVLGDPRQSAVQLLTLGMVMCLVGLATVWLLFKGRAIRARHAKAVKKNALETFRAGTEFVRNVPLFKYLAIAMFAGGFALTIIEYHFLFTVDQAVANDPARLQSFYGLYKVVAIAATLLLQWLVAGRLMAKIGLKSVFLGLPATLMFAIGVALAVKGMVGGAGGRLLARVVQRAWDEPGRRSLQGLIPDERRGSVSAFLDSYLYALATVMGCLVLAALLWLAARGALPREMAAVIYLLLAALGAGSAVWAGWRLRASYDGSLLNWRLARSRRRSVLDAIEF